EDLRQLEADLNTIAEEVRPDVITVYPETFVLRSSRPAEQLQMVGSLQVLLSNFEARHEGLYRISRSSKHRFFSVRGILDNLSMDYRIYKCGLSSEQLKAVRSYNCSGGTRVPPAQNTLGMGSLFGERDPAYTYMGKSFYCVEINQNWEPK